jgi:hypothetical protein
LQNSNPFPQETAANSFSGHLTNDTAPTAPEQPEPLEPSGAPCAFQQLDLEPANIEAGPPPEIELPEKPLRERIFQAFAYLDTRWDPSQWLGLGAILFRLTEGSEEGQDLFDYWSFYYHPDYDDSKGITPLWEWFKKGGRSGASMRTIRCFMAAGFALDELLPEILDGAEDEEVASELTSEELA